MTTRRKTNQSIDNNPIKTKKIFDNMHVENDAYRSHSE